MSNNMSDEERKKLLQEYFTREQNWVAKLYNNIHTVSEEQYKNDDWDSLKRGIYLLTKKLYDWQLNEDSRIRSESYIGKYVFFDGEFFCDSYEISRYIEDFGGDERYYVTLCEHDNPEYNDPAFYDAVLEIMK